MGKIVYFMGKSSTGKDTLYKELLKQNPWGLKELVLYTTRPIRQGEQDGVEYFFTDEAHYRKLCAEDRIIEERAYNTCHGLWRYFTVDDGQIRLEENHYICIGTLKSFWSMCERYGREAMIPVLITLDDGIRLKRALEREMAQENPKYEEMCRRFLADKEDFAEEKIRQAGITRTFCNEDLSRTLAEIGEYISDNL